MAGRLDKQTRTKTAERSRRPGDFVAGGKHNRVERKKSTWDCCCREEEQGTLDPGRSLFVDSTLFRKTCEVGNKQSTEEYCMAQLHKELAAKKPVVIYKDRGKSRKSLKNFPVVFMTLSRNYWQFLAFQTIKPRAKTLEIQNFARKGRNGLVSSSFWTKRSKNMDWIRKIVPWTVSWTSFLPTRAMESDVSIQHCWILESL